MQFKNNLIALALFMVGCTQRVPISNSNVDLTVEQSHTLIKAGESVTFTAHASGVAGRDDEIKWDARGGDLKIPNDLERHAQIRYDRPGTYSVTSSLYVDGNLVDRETAMVRVEPLT